LNFLFPIEPRAGAAALVTQTIDTHAQVRAGVCSLLII
jgi:hypothetical protein